MGLIEAQVNSALKKAPVFLDELSEETDHPHDAETYQDTKHELSFNTKKVAERFLSSYGEAFDALISNTLSKRPGGGGVDTSSISGAAELEEKLALETMISKAKSRTEMQVHNITRHLNSIMGDDWSRQHDNPFDPEHLVLAWLRSMHVMQLQSKGNLAMFSLFDSEVLKVLPKLYDKVGDFLEDLPKQKSGGSQPRQKRQEVDDFADYEAAFGDGVDSSTVADPADAGREVDYDSEPPPERLTKELVELLDKLQANRDLDDSQFYDGSYELDFRGLLDSYNAAPEGEVNPWTIGQINDDVVDMTGLLFSYIMEDANLPDDIRYHIARLQIPYLKIGLLDKSMFASREHPARLLLNNLSQAIANWDPTHPGGLDLLLQETINVINYVIEHFEHDITILSELNDNFSAFLAGDQHLTAEMLERKQKTESKTEQTDNARVIIEGQLQDICTGKRIPPIINRILEEHWAKVLFLEYMKNKDESPKYHEYIETAVMLVDSVQPKRDEDSRKQMSKSLPSLVKRIKQGLESISLTTFDSTEVLKELQECHMLVLKEKAEDYAEEDFEVTESEYQEFIEEQNTPVEWNREELESALLEERIERSLNQTSISPDAFDNNPNVMRGSRRSTSNDPEVNQAAREREIIDNELKEAREAYERALQEHQAQKAQTKQSSGAGAAADDGDDFMTNFFQDPAYLEKQYSPDKDKSAESELGFEIPEAQPEQRDAVEPKQADDFDIFSELEQTSAFPVQPEPYEVEVERIEKKRAPIDDMPDAELKGEALPDNSEEVAGRAGAALDTEPFNDLDDDKVSELIGRLKVGLWVDLVNESGQSVRAKIMAIVPTVGKYIFGDRSGRKLADFNKETLADALRTGKIRVSEDENVFDKTLESVISNLRVMKKAKDE